MTDRLLCYIDGAARGNPGPAAIGVVLYAGAKPDGEPVFESGATLGSTTNNTAEYRALLSALGKARDLGAKVVAVRSDSQLLVRQMTGQYRVKQPHLQLLHGQAKRLEAGFEHVSYEHIPRTQNRRADQLANQALDTQEES